MFFLCAFEPLWLIKFFKLKTVNFCTEKRMEHRMKRRHVLGILGGASIAGPALVGCATSKPSIMSIIDTPEKRKEYARGLLRELCTYIGPHPSGTPEHDRAAAIFEREMKRSLDKVEQVWFDMEGWKLIGTPLFKVGDTELEACPYYGTPGTPPEGITGILHKSGNSGYTLIDPKSGERRAFISTSPYGRAITHGDHRRTSPSLTQFGLGKQDIPFLDKAVQAKTPVIAKAEVEFTSLVSSSSVVGTLPGKSKEEILFVAHIDTVYTAPGANDNTASALVMVMLAHAAAGSLKPDRTMTFIATGAEEYGFLGAWKCAQLREKNGAMQDIKYVINFDSLTYGPNLQVYSTDADMRDLIKSIHSDLKINATPKYFEDSGYTMDSLPFKPSGAKALYINSRGYDERTLPVYHRIDDNAESVPLDCVETGFRVFEEFIRRVGKV